MIRELDVPLPDGRTLHAYDTGPADAPLTVVWHHGTPQIGTPPDGLFDDHGFRWVGYDRPGYGGSTPLPGRVMAHAAADTAAVADALGIDRFAVLGASSGGPHALACAALLPDRVIAAACLASLAPPDAAGLDWHGGMAPGGAAELRAAAAGRDALAAHLAEVGDAEPDVFIDRDFADFATPIGGWLGRAAGQGMAGGPGGFLDDDLANVTPWGFDVDQVAAPVVLLHGTGDRCVPASHSEWLADRCDTAELVLCPDEGHISVWRHVATALDRLRTSG